MVGTPLQHVGPGKFWKLEKEGAAGNKIWLPRASVFFAYCKLSCKSVHKWSSALMLFGKNAMWCKRLLSAGRNISSRKWLYDFIF